MVETKLHSLHNTHTSWTGRKFANTSVYVTFQTNCLQHRSFSPMQFRIHHSTLSHPPITPHNRCSRYSIIRWTTNLPIVCRMLKLVSVCYNPNNVIVRSSWHGVTFYGVPSTTAVTGWPGGRVLPMWWRCRAQGHDKKNTLYMNSVT
jgi:hypothetical protein